MKKLWKNPHDSLASIHPQQTSAPSHQTPATMSSSTTTTKTTKSLSVVKRESFFDDSFFTDAWDDFDKAMQGVLDKFDNTGLKVSACSFSVCL